MMAYPLTLDRLLERARRWFPTTGIVARQPDGSVRRSDYAAWHQRATALAGGLLQAGLRPGDRVATLLWNQSEHVDAYFGVPLAGGVVHPLNVRLHPAQLAAIVRHAGDRFALVDASLLDLWREIGVPVERVIVCPDAYEALLATSSPTPLPTLEENAAAAMAYTSGTTGEPKGVVYTHRALVLHALATALPDAMNLRAADCVLPLVPMFHANAWGIPYTAAMIGCKLVLPGAAFDAESALQLLAQEQVTFSAGVPVIWDRILDALEQHPGRWRLHPELRVNLGGAPAPEALFHRFDRQGIRVHMGWGMTEMSPVGAINPNFGPGAQGGHGARLRQGRLLPLIEGRAGDSGELEVRGPWVADQYWGGAAPEAWTADGWLRTGDIVAFDAQGLMTIVDRAHDLIRSGGEWISSVALENALLGLPEIQEAAVIAVPDPKWQERPLALIVLRPGAAADPAAWRRSLEQSFAPWQCPDRFLPVAVLPRTPTGKIDKRALRAQFA
jgi:fatty-acyl-CoA synthase